jgi:hypothetical protein
LNVTGFYVGSCGDFDILSDFAGVLHGVDVFDKNGLPVREVTHIRLTRGESVYYNSTDPQKFVLGAGEVEQDLYLWEDGTLVSDQWTGVPFKVVLPGYGAIFMETGRGLWDFTTNQLLFNSGQNQFADGDLAALCNALQ